ncbi:aldehyde dehydrogenase family protein [Sphingomonas sp. G-3-2-10]|uniref:aldehyde dehydrogenase family protein n=1 Tax=Sphingomonas sp. G-3-2-10 TaxID=2728838 RepID=UPI00146CA31B|nr:aldehyde dehydrogenase family protein [Sphingomonas sp. G-3-2-10]NML08411.1 aldehyde dehydrogenase family protein [Sphingomonas sp. G-3-2-10]
MGGRLVNAPRQFLNLIDGQARPAASGEWIDSIDPATGQVWAQVPAGGAADIDDAVAAARRAFRTWRRTPAMQRAALLRALAAAFAEWSQSLAEIETRDNGRILTETTAGDLPAVVQMLHYWAGAADKIHGETVDIGPASINYVQREPIGVIGMIVPWNAPLAIFVAKAGAALAAGNTIVVKPPESASCSILEAAALFEKAGFPPGVMNVVAGLGSVAGDALAGHPDVGKIAFTGSTATAGAITARTASAIKPLSFELGGKSANIVFADADLDLATVGVTTAAIYTGGAGQACIAGSRILVQRPVYEEMIERIGRAAAAIRLGDPMDRATQMGPIALEGQYGKVRSYLDIGLDEGAEMVLGGGSGAELFEPGSALGGGYFVQPTLFAGVRPDMRIYREEIFGPVACIVPFDDEEEAIGMANDSPYGLACGLWTNQLKRAHRVAAGVDVGAVWINTYRRIHWALPFGGMKQSGYGRDSGMESLRGYQHTKSVWVDLT